MPKEFDGLISFPSFHHAIRAEIVLKRANLETQLVANPRELISNYGMLLRFDYAHQEAALEALSERGVRVDNVYLYQSRTDAWQQT